MAGGPPWPFNSLRYHWPWDPPGDADPCIHSLARTRNWPSPLLLPIFETNSHRPMSKSKEGKEVGDEDCSKLKVGEEYTDSRGTMLVNVGNIDRFYLWASCWEMDLVVMKNITVIDISSGIKFLFHMSDEVDLSTKTYNSLSLRCHIFCLFCFVLFCFASLDFAWYACTD